MPKRLVIALVYSALLSGCSNNSLKELSSSNSSQNFNMDIYGELIYKNDEYYLSDKFYLDNFSGREDSGDTASFKFNIPTLRPAFASNRFECQKSLSNNGCEAYEDKEHLFQYVNFFKSGYGDTYLERWAKEQEEGISAGEAALHVVASPVYLSGAAGAAAAVVLMSPFIAIKAAVDPEKTSQRNNYVEFHHDDFEDEVVDAIEKSSFVSLEGYVTAANNASKLISEIESVSSKRQGVSQNKRDALREGISKYYTRGNPHLENVYKFSVPSVLSFDQVLAQGARLTYLKSVDDFYIREDARILNEYREIELRAKEMYKKEQISTFASLATSGSVRSYITTYENLDLAGLIPAAKSKLNELLNQEEKARLRQAKLAEEQRLADEKERQEIERLAQQRRIAQLEELKKWRGSLKVGSDTFCGPVIDINQVMVKIAVRVQLSGYSSEAWLKKNELFPPSYGCRNRNGILSPHS